MRVAIYASDEHTEPETQLPQLRAWCAAAGHDIVGEYIDHGVAAAVARRVPSGRSRSHALLENARQQQFDLVLAWSLREFTREGWAGTVYVLQRLAAAGVWFRSHTEPMLSTDDAAVRDVLLPVLDALTKQERSWRSECTKIGMAQARERGKQIGAPRIPAAKEAAIRAAVAAGDWGIIKIARQLKVGIGTVHRIARAEREVAAASPGPVSTDITMMTIARSQPDH